MSKVCIMSYISFVGSLRKKEKRKKMVSRGNIVKPQLMKAKTVRLTPIPFIFVRPPIFEESPKMSVVPKTSKEHNMSSVSD